MWYYINSYPQKECKKSQENIFRKLAFWSRCPMEEPQETIEDVLKSYDHFDMTNEQRFQSGENWLTVIVCERWDFWRESVTNK